VDRLGSEAGADEQDCTTERLGLLLRDKRILLVIDGVWEANDALPFIQAAIGSKCAVLATTRLTSVADALASFDKSRTRDENIHILPVLSEEDALTLLRHIAPNVVESHPDECRGPGKLAVGHSRRRRDAE
jgi:serine/threonine protein phosphatase PrpC